MMRRSCLAVCFFVFCAAILLAGPAEAKVYIDIDSPTFQKFPIAVTDFVALGGSGDPEISAWFAAEMGRYLQMTGFFSLVDRKAFLEDPSSSGITADKIRFDDWTAVGADYLVKGGFQEKQGTMVAEFRLFDTVKGEMLVGKRYTGKTADRLSMIHSFLDEILMALTGERSPLDTKIAFVMKKGKESDVYTVNFDGTGLTRLTNERSIVMLPRWSPDGRSIAFTSYREGNPDLYIYKVDKRETRRITGFKGLNLCGCWSPDGGKLLFTLSYVGNEEIYVVDLGSGRLKRLTHNFDIDVSPVWSPDGTRIAFVSNRSGSPQIYVMDAEGNNPARLTQDGNYNTSPAWSPRGKKIAFDGSVDRHFQIFTINEDGTNLNQLTAGMEECESPSCLRTDVTSPSA